VPTLFFFVPSLSRARRASLWRLLVLTGCSGGMQSGVRTPAPAPAPAAPPPVAVVSTWRPAYPTTPVAYRVQVDTRLARDSAGSREDAPVQTTARVAIAWPSVSGGARRVQGRVSEFVIGGSDRIADPAVRAAPLVATFEGSVDSVAVRVSLVPALANECDAPQTAALALARELLVRWPAALTIGQTWRDSSVTFVCRGGVPMTSRVRARYEVRGGADSSALDVVRVAEVDLSGEVRQPFRAVRVRGRGTGEHHFFLDRASGMLSRVEGSSTTELSVIDAARGGEQRVRQTATFRAQREP
jgi:hypothetical protein